MRSQKAHRGVFHVLESPQDRVLVVNHKLLEAGILHADVVFETPVVENGPLEGGTNEIGNAAGAKQIAEVGIVGEITAFVAGL